LLHQINPRDRAARFVPPYLALFLCVLVIVLLFREDKKTFQRIPPALWLPLIHFFILSSRLPDQWFSQSIGSSLNAFQDGSPLDRSVHLGLLLGSGWVLSRRPAAFRTLFLNNWPLTLYLVYTLTSIAWSDFPLIASRRWIRDLGLYFTIGVVVTDLDLDSALRLLFRRLAYLTLTFSTLLIKYFPDLSRGFDQYTGQAYNYGIATSKNGLGAVSLICVVYLLWDSLTPHQTSKRSFRVIAVNLALLADALWLLSLSSSATSLLCCVMGALLLTLMSFRPGGISPRAVAWIFLLALIAYIPADYFLDITEVVVRSAGRNMTLTGRTDVWAEIIRMNTAPILGAGYESFWLGERIAHLWQVFLWGPVQAHNGYLELYINLGMVGVVLVFGLMCFLCAHILRALKTERSNSPLAMCFFAIFIFYNMTEAAIRSCDMFYALLVCALAVSSRRMVRSADRLLSDDKRPRTLAWRQQAAVASRSAASRPSQPARHSSSLRPQSADLRLTRELMCEGFAIRSRATGPRSCPISFAVTRMRFLAALTVHQVDRAAVYLSMMFRSGQLPPKWFTVSARFTYTFTYS
jgi:exopolysaccharide production protein ExoQ